MKDPTPAEIAAKCASIQRKWSPETEKRRRDDVEEPYTIPVVKGPRVRIYEKL